MKLLTPDELAALKDLHWLNAWVVPMAIGGQGQRPCRSSGARGQA